MVSSTKKKPSTYWMPGPELSEIFADERDGEGADGKKDRGEDALVEACHTAAIVRPMPTTLTKMARRMFHLPTWSTNVGSVTSSVLPFAFRRSRKPGTPSRSDVSSLGGALCAGSSSRIGWICLLISLAALSPGPSGMAT